MTSRNMNVSEQRPMFRSVVLGRNNPHTLHRASTMGSVTPRPTRIAGTTRISSCRKETFISNSNNKVDNSSIFTPTELRPVPFYYPIEKTSKVVEEDNTITADSLLHTITSRITNCMRNLSIEAIYDNKNARASLTTIEGVQIQLSLWDMSSKRRESGKKKILIELQRCKGDRMIFHEYSRNILRTATTAVGTEKSNNKDDSSRKRKVNTDAERSMAKKQFLSTRIQNTTEEEEYENTIAALEIAHTLLMKDRMDAKQLGLESLCFMTDSNKNNISRNTKAFASQVVLFGSVMKNKNLTSTTPLFQGIKEAIASLITCNAAPGEEGKFRNLALTIFANALNVVICSDTGMQPFVVGDNDNIICTLVNELISAERISQHTAYLSTKCLGLLCASNNGIKQKVVTELGGADEKYNIIYTALDVGCRTHQKLELECRKFLEEIMLPSN